MELGGLLFFPITPFDADGVIDEGLLETHIRERIEEGANCVFAACGTGEFNSLKLGELVCIAETAARAAAGRVPVFIGLGGHYGGSREVLASLEAAGADGILLMPPYLVSGTQQGLMDYVRSTVERTRLPIIVYQRGSMVFSPQSVVELASYDTVIGLKDGVGDLARMQAIVSAIRATGNRDFLFFNGLPTAEVSMRAYRAIGVPLYSSAVFAFAPDIAMAFYRALDEGDDILVEELLNRFYHPFTLLRDRGKGYQVALVKAAVYANGRSVGSVRAPLTDPKPEDVAALESLLHDARAVLGPALRPIDRANDVGVRS